MILLQISKAEIPWYNAKHWKLSVPNKPSSIMWQTGHNRYEIQALRLWESRDPSAPQKISEAAT
jgi:hypothetical protein